MPSDKMARTQGERRGVPRIGLGYRRRIAQEIWNARGHIDCLEILVEHFLPLTPARRRELAKLREEFLLIPHGVGLSIGSMGIVDYPYLDDLKQIIRLIDAPFFGEHLSISRADGLDIWHLSPVWRTEEQLRSVEAGISQTVDALGVPFALETITELISIPNADYEYDEFYAEICTRSGADLLLDITNILINQANGISECRQQPFGRLTDCCWRQMHIVGYTAEHDGYLIDSHDAPIQDEVFDAYATALSIQIPDYVIIERDGGFQSEPSIFAEIERLRLMSGARSGSNTQV